jgi:hypothetical protein
MTKSKVILILLLIIAVVLGALTATGLLRWGEEPKTGFQKNGLLTVICDVEVSRPKNGLGQPFDVENMTMPAEFDFDEKTGWYPGEFTISQNRKGTLTVTGPVLEISRPAMFKKYGFAVLGDHVTLDRSNGSFKQWIDLEGAKRLELITGSCRRTTNAPF